MKKGFESLFRSAYAGKAASVGRRRPLPTAWRGNGSGSNTPRHLSATDADDLSHPFHSWRGRWQNKLTSNKSSWDPLPTLGGRQQTRLLSSFPTHNDNDNEPPKDTNEDLWEEEPTMSTSMWNQQVQEFLNQKDPHPSNVQQAHTFLEELRSFLGPREGSRSSYHAVDINISVAFQLLDRVLLSSSTGEDSIGEFSYSETSMYTSHLNYILQLWRQCADSTRRMGDTIALDSTMPTPQEILQRLDDYRAGKLPLLTSTVIILPDVKSYNILLAGAGAMGELDFCRHVYQWMWKESQMDSLLRPDRVTLRTLFQVLVQNNSEELLLAAAEECEVLVNEYLSRSPRDAPQIYQSLLHIWSMADPFQARIYLQDMIRDYYLELRHGEHAEIDATRRYPPPGTLEWNRLISAFSIAHEMPEVAMDVLQDFWKFSIRMQETKRKEFKNVAEQSLILSNAHTFQLQAKRLTDIPQPDLFSYNSVLEGWARLGKYKEANEIYHLIRQEHQNQIRPNIVTFTSAMKANGANLDKVFEIAQDCLEEYRDQTDDHIQLDRAFFHTWLEACVETVRVMGKEDNGALSSAITTAETIVLKIMPTVNITPTRHSFGFLLQCFVECDDLEGATKWLLTNMKDMDERCIVDWALELSHRGDIELVSFMDRFWKSSKREPKTLLQVVVKESPVGESPEALQYLLSRLSGEQSWQVLEWIPEEHRMIPCYAAAMKSLAKEGDGPRVEDLWNTITIQTGEKASLVDLNSVDLVTLADCYTSLIHAWSKNGNMERTQHWWDVWTKDAQLVKEIPPPKSVQMAVLTCLCEAFQPKQTQQFFEELQELSQAKVLPEAPDLTMLNVTLKAWILAANGRKASTFLKRAEEHHAISPDAISHNAVIEAYVKERKLDQALVYAQEHENSVIGFPNVATFHKIIYGWSLHRQDYTLALDRARSVVDWMNKLYLEGRAFSQDPRQDEGIQSALRHIQRKATPPKHKKKMRQGRHSPVT